MGTIEQHLKITNLKKIGYKWTKELSCAYAAVVLSKGSDIYVFTLDGEILHNPATTIINTN